MKRIILFLIISLVVNIVYAQQNANSKSFSLGNKKILVNIADSAIAFDSICFVHVHDDEQTALQTLRDAVDSIGGNLISIQNNKNRIISFKYNKTNYKIDPNRIYTSGGRKKTLQTLSGYNLSVAKIVKSFADSITAQFANYPVIIAMHNNTDKKFSIKHYKMGGAEAVNAIDLFINDEMDEDDFVYTTSREIFNFLKLNTINVILQDNDKCVDDGSLSYVYRNKKAMYINIEAQHGHLKEQKEMLEKVLSYFQINNKVTND